MKVLYLADGNSAHTCNWINLLAGKGIDITLFSLTSFDKSSYAINNFADAKFNSSETNTNENDGSKLLYLKALGRIKEIIRDFKPDIVHAHYATSYGLLGILSRFHPLIISVWGSDVYYFPKKSFLHRSLLRFNLNNADQLLSTSSAMALEAMNYTIRNIDITPFGIDTENFKARVTDDLLEKDKIVIGTVKTMDEIYGIEYLVKAFHILNKKYSNLRLLLVGGTNKSNIEYLKNLKKLVLDLELKDKTVFTGQIPYEKAPEFHNMLTIPVYLSLRESYGVSALESQACEKAIVVSDVGGLPEVVKENETGFIVKSCDENEAARAIERLILDENLRRQMGKNARNLVLEKFSQEVVARKMIEIYNRVLDNHEKSKK